MRVKLLKDIYQDANDYSPAGYLGFAGDYGEIKPSSSGTYPVYIKLRNGNVVGVAYHEYQLADGDERCPDCLGVGYLGTDGQACHCVRMR